MSKIPFVFVGDHPSTPTGLGRILGDLARKTFKAFPELDVRVVGWRPWTGMPASGVEQEIDSEAEDVAFIPMTTWAFAETQKNWGADAVIHAYRQWFGDRDGFLMSVWDPSRCLPFAEIPLPVTKWGYFAVDGANTQETFGGPAAQAVQRYDRVLAYTNYGANVLANVCWGTRGDMEGRSREIAHIPHGIYTKVFQPFQSQEDVERAIKILRAPRGRLVIGTVATNQARKDWGLVAETLANLVNRGHDVHGWWHTDKIVSEAWSLPQLAEDFKLTDRVVYTTSLKDDDLARCYAACVATIAPGRGEGFGYPIVESLACGTPAYHVKHAGGADVAMPEHLIEPFTAHLVGPYGISRPILKAWDVAEAIEGTIRKPDAAATAERARCRAHALKYDWATVWPQFEAWMKKGLGKA